MSLECKEVSISGSCPSMSLALQIPTPLLFGRLTNLFRLFFLVGSKLAFTVLTLNPFVDLTLLDRNEIVRAAF